MGDEPRYTSDMVMDFWCSLRARALGDARGGLDCKAEREDALGSRIPRRNRRAQKPTLNLSHYFWIRTQSPTPDCRDYGPRVSYIENGSEDYFGF